MFTKYIWTILSLFSVNTLHIISAMDLSIYSDQVKKAFLKEKIFPGVLPDLPKKLIWVEFDGKNLVRLGNELLPSQVQEKPFVHFEANDYSYFTLAMIDPDAVSSEFGNISQVNHFLVGNIPGNDVPGGEILAEYLGSQPPEGTGFHRYIFYLLKQPDMLLFDEIQIKQESEVASRFYFDLKRFTEKYDLEVVAGNFFYSKFQNEEPDKKQNRISGC